jgi:hypothetical protein
VHMERGLGRPHSCSHEPCSQSRRALCVFLVPSQRGRHRNPRMLEESEFLGDLA